MYTDLINWLHELFIFDIIIKLFQQVLYNTFFFHFLCNLSLNVLIFLQKKLILQDSDNSK